MEGKKLATYLEAAQPVPPTPTEFLDGLKKYRGQQAEPAQPDSLFGDLHVEAEGFEKPKGTLRV